MMMQIVRIFLSILLILGFTQCAENPVSKESKSDALKGVLANNAMVVSARKEASEIGVAIMNKGGNAFDAMVATHFALAVAYPVAGNIGGGGFTVYRLANGEKGTYDFREKAPLSAHRDMYLDEEGNVIDGLSTLGALAIGVPGSVGGIFEIYKAHCTLPFQELIQPAIDLAKRGVVVTENDEEALHYYAPFFKEANKGDIFLNRDWKQGDTIKYVELAKTLERIRDNGVEEFYEGYTAKMMIEKVQELGGILTEQDLKAYNVKKRDPLVFKFRDFEIISMAPPSSGGICLAQILKSLEPYKLEKLSHNSPEYIQLLVEAERRSYADRAYYLGDPDFVEIPQEELISAEYLNDRMSSFNWTYATPSTTVSHGLIEVVESDQTTHYSIIDPFGNAVSVTTTLNGGFGSKVYVEKAGFFLNNEMDDLSIKPGVPNMFGLVGAEANAIEPEKRMLSSMTPTIVEQNGNLKMVLGSPGGSTIITSVVQNILNVGIFNMGMQESVSKSRFHHQWLPDEIKFESQFDTLNFAQLREKGYKIDHSNARIIGKVDAILVLENGLLEGGADPRGDDTAIGY
ncbi:gamma-glutamyltransferase [Namhaeicola litoreus]|uniref:Glutathione hydrolase proenzyme n=1 Tax=Namhaeicola litoreus TaxID=1052145 RepID=A0ABW3Y4E3_9FLAO